MAVDFSENFVKISVLEPYKSSVLDIPLIFRKNFISKFLLSILPDQRAKEEEAIRKAEAAARDQADAGTPSREEAGKFAILFITIFTSIMNL